MSRARVTAQPLVNGAPRPRAPALTSGAERRREGSHFTAQMLTATVHRRSSGSIELNLHGHPRTGFSLSVLLTFGAGWFLLGGGG